MGCECVKYSSPPRDAHKVLLAYISYLCCCDAWHSLVLLRLRLRAERSIPLAFSQQLQAYLCAKGGMILGDLPPYEAFPIGGTSSVRGYSEGGVGSGRSYVAGTAELHFPLVAPLGVSHLY